MNSRNEKIIIKLPKLNIDIFNIGEISQFVNNLYHQNHLENAYTEIYLSKYNEVIITIKENKHTKVFFHFDSNIYYKIDINLNLLINPNKYQIYYYQDNYYLKKLHKFNKKENILLSELSEIYLDEPDEIYQKGIIISKKLLIS